MAEIEAKPIPKRDELWLSRPPFSLIARVVDVDRARLPLAVSYELCDDDGSVLARISDIPLDETWWRAFQPLTPRFG